MLENKTIYPRYRLVIGFLICLTSGVIYYAISMVYPLLTYISTDMNVNIVTAGISGTINTFFMGIALFLGAIFVGKFTTKVLMVLGFIAIAGGQLVIFFSTSFVDLIIGRAFVGIGSGILTTGSVSIFTTWFSVNERPIVISAASIISMIFTYLSYAVAIPVYETFGNSWRNSFLLVALVSTLLAIGWAFLGKENKAYNENLTVRTPDIITKSKKTNGLSMAMRRKDIWILTGFAGVTTIAATGIGVYLPSFLQLYRGNSVESAITYASFSSLAGIPGLLLSGVLASMLGRRKILFLPAALLAAIAFVAVLFVNEPAGIIMGVIVYGFCNSVCWNLAATIITELDGASPEIAAGGNAIIFGFGSIFAFFINMKRFWAKNRSMKL